MSAPYLPALRREGYIDGIDVSCVQGDIDWTAVAEAGFRFVFVKTSEGLGLDPKRLANLDGARRAGLRACAYHFGHVSIDAVAQAEHFWNAVGDTMPSRVALDLESAPHGIRPTDVVAWALRFTDAVEDRFGRPPVLYTYPAFAAALQPIEPALARCPLWIAHYASTTFPWVPSNGFGVNVPRPWTTWTVHQYSGNGGFRVPGIAVDCDRNLLRGDEGALRELCGEPSPLDRSP